MTRIARVLVAVAVVTVLVAGPLVGQSSGTTKPATSASQWSVTAPPQTSNPFSRGLSCSAANWCLAAYGTSQGTSADIQSWNGISWTDIGSLPVEAQGLSCWAVNSCIVFGAEPVPPGSLSGYAATWNGSQWNVLPSITAIAPYESQISEMSCSSAQFCMAGGDYFTSNWNSFVAEWNGSQWINVVAPFASSDVLNGGQMSCRSATFCALASSGVSGSLLATWNGAAWTSQDFPLNSYYTVSCGSSISCMALGFASPALWNGTSWRMILASGPSAGNTEVIAVGCASSVQCVATNSSNGAVEPWYWNGSLWTADTASLPAPSGATEAIVELIACPADNECIATGDAESSSNQFTGPVAYEYESGGGASSPETLTSTATPSAVLGAPIADSATLSNVGANAGGTITFSAYSDSACKNRVFPSAPIAVSGSGTYPPSGSTTATFTPGSAGTYYWIASYSGDPNDSPISTSCGADGQASVVTIGRYVALGDSYSSGEGNPPFIMGTDSSTNQCHRSDQGYGPLLANALHVPTSEFVFAACSGAIMADLVANLPGAHGQYTDGPQLSAIAPANQPSLDTGLVTLSIGGNDAGFATVINHCISGFGFVHPAPQSGCLTSITTNLNLGSDLLVAGGTILVNTMNNSWNFCNAQCQHQYAVLGVHNPNDLEQVVTVPSLEGLLEEIHQRAPHAEILVMQYPHLFPQNPPAQCIVGQYGTPTHTFDATITRTEMSDINQATDFLDGVIANAALLAQQAGVNTKAVDTRPDFQNGHEVCSNSNIASLSQGSWINPLDLNGFPPSALPGSFHPNAAGQAEFEQDFDTDV